MKCCSKCRIEKPLTDFREGKGYADGYRSQCKECLSISSREYKQRPDVQQHRRDYEKTHTRGEHRRAYQREWHQRPDVKARVLAYMQRPDVNERVRERERQRWANDPKLREYKRTYLRKRYRENTEHKRKQIGYSMRALHARRARKQNQGGSYTAQEWRDLCARYDHRCLCCGEQKRLTIDHVLPISLGGSNSIDNIQPLCLACNLRKHAKHVDYRPQTQPPWALG